MAKAQEARRRASGEVPGQVMEEKLGVAENPVGYQADPSALISSRSHGETEAQREKGSCSRSHWKSMPATLHWLRFLA